MAGCGSLWCSTSGSTPESQASASAASGPGFRASDPSASAGRRCLLPPLFRSGRVPQQIPPPGRAPPILLLLAALASLHSPSSPCAEPPLRDPRCRRPVDRRRPLGRAVQPAPSPQTALLAYADGLAAPSRPASPHPKPARSHQRLRGFQHPDGDFDPDQWDEAAGERPLHLPRPRPHRHRMSRHTSRMVPIAGGFRATLLGRQLPTPQPPAPTQSKPSPASLRRPRQSHPSPACIRALPRSRRMAVRRLSP